ncbi:phospholipase D, putative [Entamoeba histolytica HM-3:IMSS]|uniref:phospholipase D n=6 Tax=Entamoeba histolytica TaxID=5759 RepID=C4MA11_ENTH1|nr:phospholipase D, putative [Entamoeba histolytica HM-1:IMSS]EMD48800.1 phospholipase, putative [Entamoeba histolytica KU27]EMS17842.1 phospholipase D, putative [Entamoeba histolytica HM-3:IMSS]ENY61424.1 phospholipase D, putative [Entamoeba histolytica HM-1:IMSS-A]GAT98580.1 phospholipase d putative [Entamoeba histolytica]EAL43649.1 phospholipase D, putative [Entamoeba histolytica HM-1:IMSS]|eukprot:XP_649037.1 phospholipase D, putative [Entamoeba histolytica HM-1:IMSS]
MRSLYYHICDLKNAFTFKKHLASTHSSFFTRTGDFQFLIDGEETMQKIAESLVSAKNTIKIMGWRMDLNVPMIRTNHYLQGKTILDILMIAAKRGIKIYVLLYKSPYVSHLTKNQTTTKILNSVHPNIVCICERWSLIFSHHEKVIIIDNEIGFVGGIDLCVGRYDTHDHQISPCVKQDDYYIYPPIDYNNIQIHKTNSLQYPRMPWHDIHCMVNGTILNDLQYHFHQRWQFYNGSIESISVNTYEGSDEMKLCRSICNSSGSQNECSIYGEMLRLIRKAEHFIYIEQQYFLSNCGKKNISNKLGQAIAKKIVTSFERGKKFFVVIVLPVFSEGQLRQKSVRKILEYTRKSIYDGTNSIFNIAKKNGVIDISNYLCVCNLYNYGWCEKYGITSSQIYVHSKLMIIDDRYALIGSANMNDRSLRGDRDTEIAISIKETNQIKELFGREEINVCKKISSLRKKLWMEHLGFKEHLSLLVEDAYECFETIWKQVAHENRLIYEQVFPLFPRDAFTYYINTEKHTHPIAVKEKLPLLVKVQGHLVLASLIFGSKEHQRSYGLTAIVT